MQLMPPVDLTFEQERQVRILKPFVMPEAKGEKKIYVIRLKNDCPFEYITIAGESITKYQYNKDWSLVKNANKPPQMQIPTFSLTKNQLEAFRKRVSEMDAQFFDKNNKKWTVRDVKDWVEICPQEEFVNKSLISANDENITP